jgi:hypothetical protein
VDASTKILGDREVEQEPLTMNRWKRWLPGLQIPSEYQAAWFAQREPAKKAN